MDAPVVNNPVPPEPLHCIGCVHCVRGVCSLICAVPEHRCDWYEKDNRKVE